MNKKRIIIGIILTLLVIAGVVLYALFPEQFTKTMNNIYDILNRPLPIVGLTSLGVLAFLWRVLITAKYGKAAVNEVKREYAAKNEAYEEKISEQNKIILAQNEKIDRLENNEIKICKAMTNKKVKAIGKEIEDSKNGK